MKITPPGKWTRKVGMRKPYVVGQVFYVADIANPEAPTVAEIMGGTLIGVGWFRTLGTGGSR